MQTCGNGIKMTPDGTVTGPRPATKGTVPSASGPRVGGKHKPLPPRGGKR